MISFFRGPGGFWRRVAAELVPLGCALVAGGLYLPLGWTLPVGFAVAAGLLTVALTWLAVSVFLRVVRRRPALRRLYRLAVLLHVLFWSALGIAATANEPAGALLDGGASGWKEPVPFEAGVARTAFTLPAHATLAGWGQKPRRITLPPFGGLGPLGRLGQSVMGSRASGGGRLVPLFRTPDGKTAREKPGVTVLVLRPADPAAGRPVAIVRVDLVTADRGLHAAIVERVADLGYRPEGLLLAATHTHSGPGGYSRVPMSAVIGTDHFDPEVFAVIRDACATAVRAAHGSTQPARVALIEGRDRDASGNPVLSRNRRKTDAGAIDDRVYGLRVDAREKDYTIAVVLNYAVHPTLMRRRHMAFDRDLVGAIEDQVSQAVPNRPFVILLNGAQGDIAPRRVPDASGRKRARLLAQRFAQEVFRPAWKRAAPSRRTQLRVGTARTRRRLVTPRLVKGVGARDATLDALYGPLWSGGPGTLAANALALPLNAFVWSLGLPELRFGFSWRGAAGFCANLEEGVGADPYQVGAWTFEVTGGDGRSPQRFALIWQPAEATQGVGKRWRQAVAGLGIEDTMLVGLAGGSAAYVTTEDEYHASGYEAVGTLYGPNCAAHFEEALLDALVRAGNSH